MKAVHHMTLFWNVYISLFFNCCSASSSSQTSTSSIKGSFRPLYGTFPILAHSSFIRQSRRKFISLVLSWYAVSLDVSLKSGSMELFSGRGNWLGLSLRSYHSNIRSRPYSIIKNFIIWLSQSFSFYFRISQALVRGFSYNCFDKNTWGVVLIIE